MRPLQERRTEGPGDPNGALRDVLAAVVSYDERRPNEPTRGDRQQTDEPGVRLGWDSKLERLVAAVHTTRVYDADGERVEEPGADHQSTARGVVRGVGNVQAPGEDLANAEKDDGGHNGEPPDHARQVTSLLDPVGEVGEGIADRRSLVGDTAASEFSDIRWCGDDPISERALISQLAEKIRLTVKPRS